VVGQGGGGGQARRPRGPGEEAAARQGDFSGWVSGSGVGKRQGGIDGVCDSDVGKLKFGRDPKMEHGILLFWNPLIFVSLTDEYRWIVAISPTLQIFLGAGTSPMNICGLYLSVMRLHRRLYGPVQSQVGPLLYSLVPGLNRRI
jgi:hypothetical protein